MLTVMNISCKAAHARSLLETISFVQTVGPGKLLQDVPQCCSNKHHPELPKTSSII